ncbi:hypothetical protein Tco_0717832 [Tanacetum coccineum]
MPPKSKNTCNLFSLSGQTSGEFQPKMNNQTVNSLVFKFFFEKEKLYGPNFINWYQNLRFVLSAEDKLTCLEHPIPAAPVPTPRQQLPLDALAAHNRWLKASKEIAYLMLMKSYIENLERLGHPVSLNLATSLVLITLSKEYDAFVQNYNMHGMGKIVNELHAILNLHEQTLPKKDVSPALHVIRAGRIQKNNKNKKLQKAVKGKN